jgi:hypothetical protein
MIRFSGMWTSFDVPASTRRGLSGGSHSSKICKGVWYIDVVYSTCLCLLVEASAAWFDLESYAVSSKMSPISVLRYSISSQRLQSQYACISAMLTFLISLPYAFVKQLIQVKEGK